ncbi:MAG: sigma 54-interacting transcriptional regulator [Thermodesulfobacteriota bacterium]
MTLARESGEVVAPPPPALSRIITADPKLKRILAQLPGFAATELPVLIMGEPGTGKELVAEALWSLSSRRHQPFYRLNCAVLSGDLASSELFGHLKGSFTGAYRSSPGKFRLAHRGTLFLDEVGELPLVVQPRLLRAVEQGEIEPVGGSAPLKVDVRLVAATNQNLPQLIPQGCFRRDLYDRLAVLPIYLPPLRERGDDLLLLADYFLKEEARRYRRAVTGFSAAARRRLQGHPWPGNVRELKNAVTRAVLCSSGSQVRAKDLCFPHRLTGPVFSYRQSWQFPERRIMPHFQPTRPGRDHLQELLLAVGGNVSALARRLGVCTRTIYRWLRFHGLDLRQARSGTRADTKLERASNC